MVMEWKGLLEVKQGVRENLQSSTGREGLGEGLIRIMSLALWASHSFMRTATSLVAGSGV